MSHTGYSLTALSEGIRELMNFLEANGYSAVIDQYGLHLFKGGKQLEYFADEIEFVLWLEKTFDNA